VLTPLSPFPPADVAEVVRLYGLRIWVEQGYRQVKGELGWADFQVRADRAIRRHWALVCCAFSCCWRAWFTARETAWPPPPPERDLPPDPMAPALPGTTSATPATSAPTEARGEKRRAAAQTSAGTPTRPATAPAAPRAATTEMAGLAGGVASRAQWALSLERHLAHLARLVQGGTTPRTPMAPRPRRRRLQPPALSPLLTNYG
jgi:hypothetical protein